MRALAAVLPFLLLALHTAPKSGEDLVRRMHARYAGRWYHTVTFTQTTSFPDRAAQTWYEAATIPGKLRIDVAPLDSMTAFMFVGDSAVVFRHGARTGARRDRNLLMTLGFDVYAQAPETTIAQLRAEGIDLGKIREDRWSGVKVWVVGAERGDTTSGQFWIEQDRLLFVRLIQPHTNPQRAGAPPNLLDVTFENYRRLDRGWVAPRVVIKLNGKEIQREQYTGIRADVPLQADLYDTQVYRKPGWVGGP
ncbi:MAG TPA: hypothetical protein VFW66_00355 [Gemmatimonadales bacterium]|nr:hypothetical protein [Gemmatimonadales bacterium]